MHHRALDLWFEIGNSDLQAINWAIEEEIGVGWELKATRTANVLISSLIFILR